ncbi:MAG: replicative DNA helicase, partial [Clostridia bacterium]
LGAILIDSDITIDVMPNLTVVDFYSEANRIVFECMFKIYNNNRPIDFVTLTDELEQTGNLEKIGGIEQLTRLSTSIPSTANFRHYLDIVKRDSLRRTLIRSSRLIIEKTNENEDDILSFAEKEIFDISAKNGSSFPTEIGLSCNEVVDKFDKIAKDKNAYKGLTTGIKALDEMLNGMQKSDLILIAARPSEGKTSLAMNIVENASLLGNATSLVFSLEMSKVQLAQRMLCSNARVKMENAVKGLLTIKEWEQLWQAKEKLSNAHILVDDSGATTPADMLSKCRRVKAKYGLDLIMVDYIQLMSGGGKKNDNRQQEITEISRNLKLIAREMNCPLLALSQLSRSIESRTPPLPQLSDLRDSGAIEQDADVVMFIYNPDGKRATGATGENFTGNGNSGIKEIIIAKHRNGPIGTVPLRWNGEFVRFEDPVGYIKPQSKKDKEQSPDNPTSAGEIYGENLNFVSDDGKTPTYSSDEEEIYSGDSSFDGLEPPPEED